ncbi:hypothetical protein E2C01_017876 [Portunus trituberculatus]|uniref:Ig-like domain-containing protein n=1 Tax=Portunus trituberculatus TaxID=210409 RepID=A0A5B7DSZ5_PORTR|nr:hypothetical protein [Portunus trituberculatus]
MPLAPQDHEIVTGALGYAYRGYNKVLLALHTIEPQHAGTYVCEASNTAGVDSAAIRIVVATVGNLMSIGSAVKIPPSSGSGNFIYSGIHISVHITTQEHLWCTHLETLVSW